MKFIVNGQAVDVPGHISTVQDLLGHFELSNKIVVVEVDQQIIDKSTYAHSRLSEGQRIELVHFVGGG